MKKYYLIAFLAVLMLFLSNCGEKKAPVLNVYNWGAYIGETTIADFEQASGIKVNYGTYSSNEEMLGKVLASNVTYDIVFPSDYMVNQMRDKDLLAPLNFEAIPNYKNISEKFKNLPFDPQSQYSIPYHYGTCGIGYNKKYVDVEVKGFEILLDERFKDKIVVLDDMRFLMGAALKHLGYSANTKNTEELDKALELLLKVKENIQAFSVTNYIDLMIEEKAYIVFGYSAGVFQAKAKNPDIEYKIPEEGALIYVDNVCVLKNSQNKEAAYKFLNFILDAQNSAKITNIVFSASPNIAALEFVDKSISENPAIFPEESVLNKSEFLENLGESQQEYETRWIKLKK